MFSTDSLATRLCATLLAVALTACSSGPYVLWELETGPGDVQDIAVTARGLLVLAGTAKRGKISDNSLQIGLGLARRWTANVLTIEQERIVASEELAGSERFIAGAIRQDSPTSHGIFALVRPIGDSLPRVHVSSYGQLGNKAPNLGPTVSRDFPGLAVEDVYNVNGFPLIREEFVAGSFVSASAGEEWTVQNWDRAGNVIWTRALKVDGAISRVSPTRDGGVVLAGASALCGDRYQSAFLAKLDAVGVESWRSCFGEEGFPEQIGGVRQTADGGFVLAGTVVRPNDRTRTVDWNGFVVRTDGSGKALWSRIFTEQEETIEDVAITEQDTILIVGQGSAKACLTGEIEGEGNVLWKHLFKRGTECRLNRVIPTEAGALVAGGWTWSQTSTDLASVGYIVKVQR